MAKPRGCLENCTDATTLGWTGSRDQAAHQPSTFPCTLYCEQLVGLGSPSSATLPSWMSQITEEMKGLTSSAWWVSVHLPQSEIFTLFLECLGTKCRELSELKSMWLLGAWLLMNVCMFIRMGSKPHLSCDTLVIGLWRGDIPSTCLYCPTDWLSTTKTTNSWQLWNCQIALSHLAIAFLKSYPLITPHSHTLGWLGFTHLQRRHFLQMVLYALFLRWLNACVHSMNKQGQIRVSPFCKHIFHACVEHLLCPGKEYHYCEHQ